MVFAIKNQESIRCGIVLIVEQRKGGANVIREVKKQCSTCGNKGNKRADDGTYRAICKKHNKFVSFCDKCENWEEAK